MKILDLFFGTIYSSSVFFILNLILLVVSYYWWKKYKHRDYFLFFILWSILWVMKLFAYAFYNFLLPKLTSLTYFDVIVVFTILREAVSLVIGFYVFVILTKWSVKWTARKADVFNWLTGARGIFVISACALVISALLTSYLIQLWM